MNIFKAAAQKIYEQARKDKRLIEGLHWKRSSRSLFRQNGVIQTQDRVRGV